MQKFVAIFSKSLFPDNSEVVNIPCSTIREGKETLAREKESHKLSFFHPQILNQKTQKYTHINL